MNNNLLIVGAGVYAVVASEIAADMGCFSRIDFVDDGRTHTPHKIPVVGTTRDLGALAKDYRYIAVAIGNPTARLSLLEKVEGEYCVVSLVSPKAYVSSSAQVGKGCIIEPMAVVHSGCVLEQGCIVSAGAVVNHASKCARGVHVDCNGVVAGYCLVPACTKIPSGTVYKSEEAVNPEAVFLNT